MIGLKVNMSIGRFNQLLKIERLLDSCDSGTTSTVCTLYTYDKISFGMDSTDTYIAFNG